MYQFFLIVLFIAVSFPCFGSRNKGKHSPNDFTSGELIEKAQDLYHVDNRPDSAKYYLEILESRLNKKNLNSEEISDICQGLNMYGALLIYEDGDYSNAIIKLLKARQIAEKYDCREILCELIMNIAVLNYEEGQLNNSAEYKEETINLLISAVESGLESPHSTAASHALINLATLCLEFQMPQKTMPVLRKAVGKIDMPVWQKEYCNAVIAWFDGDRQKALALADKAARLVDSSNPNERDLLVFQTETLKLEMLYQKGDISLAERFNKELISKASNLNLMVPEYILWKKLRDSLVARGDTLAADKSELNMLRAKEVLTKKDYGNLISEGKKLYKNEEIRQSLATAYIKLDNYRTTGIVVGIFTVVILLLLIVLAYKYRQLAHGKRLLVKKDVDMIKISSPSRRRDNDDAPANVDSDMFTEVFSKIENVMATNRVVFSEDFSIGKLSELVGEKPQVVSNAIQKCSMQSFSSLVGEVRVKEACRRFINKEEYGDYTIEGVGLSVGYKSRSHFISVFKKFTGMSPSQYQKETLRLNGRPGAIAAS